MKKNWPESKDKEAKVKVRVEARQFPKTKYRSPRMKGRNLITTQKGEEVHKGGNTLIETLFRE